MKAEVVGGISCAPFGRGLFRMNHLLFAEDNLLFCKANSLELSKLINILEVYEISPGQMPNNDKTFIFFSCNTP